jgi:hypothetical protein
MALPLILSLLAVLALWQQMNQSWSLHQSAHPPGAAQLAYNMRLLHQAALAAKANAPSATGPLTVAAPAFLAEWRFQSCANDKSVVTYSAGLSPQQSRDVSMELLRQSIIPPELGGIGISPVLASASGLPSRVGFAPAIGLTDGRVINNGYGAVLPACPLPTGLAAIQTQLMP